MTIRNRELSQFGSFIFIDNDTKDIGITTLSTPFVGIGTTNATSKFHVYGDTKLEGDVNLTGISTFDSNVFVGSAVSIYSSTGIISATEFKGAVTGDVEGNFLRFVQSDPALNASYGYGGIKFEGNDIGNNGERGYIKGVSEGTSGQFGLVFGTMENGVSNPQERLRINSAGNANFSGTVTANSDEKLKENVVGITNALEKVMDLRGVYFNRIGKTYDDREIGVIAQEVEKVLPELVKENSDGTKAVAYQNMVAVLIEAIKEQQEQINELRSRLDDL